MKMRELLNVFGQDDYELIMETIEDAGYAVVPVEPTTEMLADVGTMDNYDPDTGDFDTCDEDHIAWWRDMIKAARG
ncbi:hypothetical protein OAF54_00715 [bacterium]|nr:hypothetical protein [bacterium]